MSVKPIKPITINPILVKHITEIIQQICKYGFIIFILTYGEPGLLKALTQLTLIWR